MSSFIKETYRVEILTIGDELLLGQIANTNAQWLAARLSEIGVVVEWITTCRDDIGAITEALRVACGRTHCIVATGGLGPTEDDVTVQTVATLLGCGTQVDEATLARIHARFQARNCVPTSADLRQAEVPSGAVTLDNPVGLAPGFHVRFPKGVEAFFLPGVPEEMRAIFDAWVAPEIQAWVARSHLVRKMRTFRTFGLREAVIGERVKGIAERVGQGGRLTVHFRTTFPENLVTFVAEGESEEEVASVLHTVERELQARLDGHLYSSNEESLAAVVGARLKAMGATLALAESCTGGLIGHLVTEVPGASQYFLFGAVTYSNDAKREVLGVAARTLEQHGAVSEQTVREMAEGVRRCAGATYGLAVSGIAGPGGGSPGKPVGTVHIAVSGPEETVAEVFHFPFERAKVKELAAYSALHMLLRILESKTPRSS